MKAWGWVIAISPVYAITCLTIDGYVESEPGILCVECKLATYLNENNTCVDLIEDVTETPLTVPTICEVSDGVVYCEENGACVPSGFGRLCTECNERGYVTDEQRCACYSNQLDPSLLCRANSLNTRELYVNVTTSDVTKTKTSCVSYQSTTYGCFAAVDDTGHKYGTVDPPVPTRCCVENVGPPPGELTESILTAGIVDRYVECNTYGGPQVDANETEVRGFRTCSNHGSWDATNRTCVCDVGWALGLVGENLDSSEIYSCVACAPFYGPDSYDSFSTPPFCSKIYTPDPVTGEDAECGGRGLFLDGKCSCSDGWTLVNVTKTEVTVETCALPSA
jgi:hypothetical protein